MRDLRLEGAIESDLMNALTTVWDALVNLLANGLLGASEGWQVLVVTLVFTHITIAAVTIFLHRSRRPTARSTCTRFPRTSSACGCG